MDLDPKPEATPSPVPPTPSRTARHIRLALTVVCAAAALVQPVAGAVGRRSWLADLISHFREPALGVTFVALTVAAVGRRRWLALGLALLAAFQAVPLVRDAAVNPVSPDPRSTQRLHVVMINVLDENACYDDVVRLIRAEKPDIVGLVEYTREWRDGLSAVREEFPYRKEYPVGTSGLALWFREPPTTLSDPEWLVAGKNPVIHATFPFAGRERHLWLVHPTSPIKGRAWIAGNPELDAIARRVGATGGSRVVIGDMNSTDGSPHFRDFLRVSGLRDSRLGFGRQGSWPTDMPYRIGIDHAFVSDDLAVVGRRLGPMVGSDHFPLIVDLAPAASTNAATQSAHASASRP